MADDALDERGAGAERGSEVRSESEGSERGEASGEGRESAFAGIARDMAVGALAGAIVGGALRVARTLQPERADEVKANVTAAAREVAAAAGTAVRDVVTSKPVNELMQATGGDGDRTEFVKSTLRDAVAAAGDAARGVLESKGGGGGTARDE